MVQKTILADGDALDRVRLPEAFLASGRPLNLDLIPTTGEFVIRSRRVIMASLMAFVGAAASVMTIASPAQAAPGACYNRSGYSFQNDAAAYVIDVYQGSGCSTSMGFVIANRSTGGQVRLAAADRKCDGKGISIVVHGYSVASSGCGSENDGVKYVSYSSIGSPKNFWLLVAGSVNSNATNLPIP